MGDAQPQRSWLMRRSWTCLHTCATVGSAHHPWHRSHSIHEVDGEFNVSTPISPAPDHLLCLYLAACVEEVSECHDELEKPARS